MMKQLYYFLFTNEVENLCSSKKPPHTAALFTIAQTWKQPRCPSESKQTHWYIQTMKYYSEIKRNAELSHEKT